MITYPLTLNNFALCFYASLILVCVFYQDDIYDRLAWLDLNGQVFLMNCQMFFRSWLLHRKLAKDFRSLGLEPPKFRFVKIQDRH